MSYYEHTRVMARSLPVIGCCLWAGRLLGILIWSLWHLWRGGVA